MNSPRQSLFVKPGFEKEEHGYVKVKITSTMKNIAYNKAIELGELKNSIRGGKGNMVGFLGQLAVEKAIAGMKHEDNYDYDLVCDGYRYEVKTKDRTSLPLPDYECSVAAYNPGQQTDYYVFVSIYRLCGFYRTAYILGYIYASEYLHKAKFLHKGEHDPSNNFDVKADCYNLPIKELRSFE